MHETLRVKIFLVNLILGALKMTDQVNLRPIFLYKCSKRLDLPDSLLCSTNLVSTVKMVSPIWVSQQLLTAL